MFHAAEGSLQHVQTLNRDNRLSFTVLLMSPTHLTKSAPAHTVSTKPLSVPYFPSALHLTGLYSCVLISAPPVNCLMANCSFNAFVSTGTGVPQQIQAIQVHPNTTNSDSSPETSHTSTNSTGKLTMGYVTYSGLMKIYI